MALLERVSALIRANLNDLIDRAEDPQKMRKLEQKLQEAQAKSELLIAKHRRGRALTKASQARMAAHDGSKMGTFDRMKNKVHSEEAMGQAMAEMANDNVEEKLDSLGKDDEIERLLADLKTRRGVA